LFPSSHNTDKRLLKAEYFNEKIRNTPRVNPVRRHPSLPPRDNQQTAGGTRADHHGLQKIARHTFPTHARRCAGAVNDYAAAFFRISFTWDSLTFNVLATERLGVRAGKRSNLNFSFQTLTCPDRMQRKVDVKKPDSAIEALPGFLEILFA
jgi:hypothetical protein